jgi:hypothetical protein
LKEAKVTGWPAAALILLILLGIVDAFERVIAGIL